MKAFILIAALLTAAEAVLANDLVAVEAPADTWCITYESTYLATVTNKGDLLPSDESGNDEPDAQNSGRLPFAPSIHPTFRRNTSISVTRSAMSTDIQDTLSPERSLSTLEVINTVDTSAVNTESSDSDANPTAAQSTHGVSTLTDGLSTMSTSTVDTEATSTSTDIIEPAGRNVIFLIQTTDNEKRAIRSRAISGFIGINNPSVCTFAATFNLTEAQLFADGVPLYYFGEDYKDLSTQGRPPRGSITSGFADSGSTLTFRNSDLPRGEAGFCQDAEGQVYITFTTGPSGCVPVNLAVYNVDQCQNGRLIGLDELTSSVSGTAITTADQSLSTPSTFVELPESTDLAPSQSIIPSSQTSELEESTTNLSHVTESSTQETEDQTSTLAFVEDLETLSSVLTTSGDSASDPTAASTPPLSSETSDLLDSTATSSDGTGLLTTSGVESQITTGIETSHIETTIKTSVSETPFILETTEATTTEDDTSGTEIVSDVDTTASTDTTDTTTTNSDAITDPEDSTTMEAETITAETTTSAETTTAETAIEPEDLTTTEAETTTAEITTTAELTTTTEAAPEPEPQFACGDPGYTTTYTYNSVTFDLQCERGWSYFPLENGNAASFGECLRFCALNTNCNGIVWIRASLDCILSSGVTARESDSRWDVAPVASRS
ncbi:hypothetical protein FSST1_006919 [Fusarium sambucinum]